MLTIINNGKWRGFYDRADEVYGREVAEMWVLFGKSFDRNLITKLGFDRDMAKMTAVKAKPRYKEIIAGLPEFEKADRFKMNIVNCALRKSSKRDFRFIRLPTMGAD